MPLPDKVWISGESAERHGCIRIIEARYAVKKAEHDGARRLLARLATKELTVRTYATTANGFKERLRKRCGDDSALLQVYSEARLPRHIWVVEAIDRTEREKGRKEGGARDLEVRCVMGEVIFDAYL